MKILILHSAPGEPAEEAVSADATEGEDMTVVEVVKSHKDPLGGGLIKDPVKSKVI